MTGGERLLAALRGEVVDRVPIWLREGFNVGGDPVGEPLESGLGAGGSPEFLLGWKRDRVYRELFDSVAPHADLIRGWGAGGHVNRFLMTPPEFIHRREYRIDRNTIRIEGWIDTPGAHLTFADELRRGYNTFWNIEHPVKTVGDLKKLARIPFSLDPGSLMPFRESYARIRREVGERGVLQLNLPSPIVAISACMSLQDFLATSITEGKLFGELLEEITRRELVIAEALFGDGGIETVVNLGGSEQCTPPLMAPEAYDTYVVPYDGRLIEHFKTYGLLVQIHCHGKVRHALRRMKEMGADATDPVEPPPAGDVTYEEARRIADGRITLMGNLEFDELEHAEPARIRERVREILRLGSDRLILTASAGPINAVTERLAENYRVWIDTALEYA